MPSRGRVNTMGKEKKVLLFVVEGPTEETALASIMECVFSSNRIFFDVVHGDITVQKGAAKNPRECVRDWVLAQMGRGKGYGWNDLERIVQICDTDGAFVPIERVMPSSAPGIEYTDMAILTPNPGGVRARNNKKAEAMRQLSRVHALTYRGKSVPYGLYFFSRNMEHALHGRGETLTDREKIRLANQFRRRFDGDPVGFREFISSEDILVPGDFRQTWDYLEDGVQSLERGSNVALAVGGDNPTVVGKLATYGQPAVAVVKCLQ